MSPLTGRTGALDWSEVNPDAGMTTLLVHSLGTNRSMWDHQVAVLAGDRRVITVDLPGHGRSSALPGSYTVDDLGVDILDVVAACGVERFEVVGISLGGLIALWLAVNAPDRVDALVACNTAGRLGSEELWSGRIEAVEAGGMEAIRDNVVRRFFAPDFERLRPEEFERYNEIFSATDPVGYVGCCAALRDGDLTAEVGSIGCPTLVIGGDRDIATPPDQSMTLHQAISGSRLEIIEGAAHLSNLDRPQAFNQVLAEFLSV